jgi:hypothetical protein
MTKEEHIMEINRHYIDFAALRAGAKAIEDDILSTKAVLRTTWTEPMGNSQWRLRRTTFSERFSEDDNISIEWTSMSCEPISTQLRSSR